MKERLRIIFGLKDDQAAPDVVRERIEAGSVVTGSNMYILLFAIVIACIGLNMNSTAVVIGAMLISPLMGVIISLAYGIASHDIIQLKRSSKRLLFQISAGVAASTIYFLISPISSFSGELAARTAPTLWDVLIAVLGGFAAIIANTRKSMISNVIPGAAIATALMPPLCTVGYCVASARWLPALGAAYLFLINAIFICFSAVIGLYLMKLIEKRSFLATGRSRVIAALLILTLIVPSAVIGWNTAREIAEQDKYDSFIKQEFRFGNTQIVKSNLDIPGRNARVTLIGEVLDHDEIKQLEDSMAEYDLNGYNLDVTQTRMEKGITREELDKMLGSEDGSVLSSSSEEEIRELNAVIDLQADEKKLQAEISSELAVLYPSLVYTGFTYMYDDEGEEELSVILVNSSELSSAEKNAVREWIEMKYGRKLQIIQIDEDSLEQI